jgi:hypothetical protein
MLEPLQNPGAYWLIRDNIIEGINRYVLYHREVGHFLTAVLENNLREALARADDENIKTIFQIVSYCHNQIPGNCWGSVEAHKEWIKVGPLKIGNPSTAPQESQELSRQERVGIWCLTNFLKEREEESRGTEG